MEILATNVSYGGAIILTILSVLFGFITWAVAVDKKKALWERISAGTALLCFVISIIVIWSDPTIVTYDAIITDWNEVHAQGYEVVEQNGKIVTLRKVGD